MTPEQRAREEELAAFIRANGEYLAGVDAVNCANAAHIKISAANRRKPVLRFKSFDEQTAKKDARLQKLASFTHPTPDQRRGQIRRYLRRTLNRLVELRDLDHDRYLKTIKAMNKNYFARELRIPKSTFGRLVNSDSGLVMLCNAIMHEHVLLNLNNIYSHKES